MIGHIVYSKRGHDKGKIFVVIAENDLYLYLVDGSKRLFKNPKRKKIKHVQVTNYICDEIIKKISSITFCFLSVVLSLIFIKSFIFSKLSFYLGCFLTFFTYCINILFAF